MVLCGEKEREKKLSFRRWLKLDRQAPTQMVLAQCENTVEVLLFERCADDEVDRRSERATSNGSVGARSLAKSFLGISLSNEGDHLEASSYWYVRLSILGSLDQFFGN